MKIFYKRILSKKGLTLVEILVVLIVASVLLLCATGMLALVNNLLNSVKGNAHMDSMCNTANEYIRGMVEKASKISIMPYPHATETAYALPSDPKIDALNNQYNDYRNALKAGEEIKAFAVMNNYPGDFRLYDFGTICKVNADGTKTNIVDLNWGLPSVDMQTFANLLSERDGGGEGKGGKNWDDFHVFDAFNDEFYSNDSPGGVGYSYQIAFETKTSDSETYLTIHSQIFKRTGQDEFDHWNGSRPVFKKFASFEPSNQIKSLSFRLLNGKASFDKTDSVNSISADGTTIELVTDADGKLTQDGLVILYVVRADL